MGGVLASLAFLLTLRRGRWSVVPGPRWLARAGGPRFGNTCVDTAESRIYVISENASAPHDGCMTEPLAVQRVEVSFVGSPPPAARVERASGVTDVEIDGSLLRCLVHGSFQPFLEALGGYEVMSLNSIPEHRTRGAG